MIVLSAFLLHAQTVSASDVNVNNDDQVMHQDMITENPAELQDHKGATDPNGKYLLKFHAERAAAAPEWVKVSNNFYQKASMRGTHIGALAKLVGNVFVLCYKF